MADDAAAQAVVEKQNRTGNPEAFDRVFAMTPAELGQAALEGTQRKQTHCTACSFTSPCPMHGGFS